MVIKAKHIVLTGLAVTAVAYGAKAAKTATAAKRLEVFTPSFKIGSRIGGMLPITVDVKIFNYTNTEIRVDHLQVLVESKFRNGEWASFAANPPQTLVVHPGTTDESITLYAPIGDLLFKFLDLFRDLKANGLKITVKGKALGIFMTLDETIIKDVPSGQVNGLGFVASHRRKINEKDLYGKYFDGLDDPRETERLPNGDQTDTVQDMARIAKEYSWQVKRLAQHLKGKDLQTTAKNIWEFCYQNIQYRPDREDREQIRSPRASWLDRIAGIDCDCFGTLVSALLSNLGIRHALRMTAYDAYAPWGHVFAIVPIHPEADLSIRDQYLVIDPVVDQYNFEVPFTKGEAQDLIIMPDRNVVTQREFLNGPSTLPAQAGQPKCTLPSTVAAHHRALGAVPTPNFIVIPGDEFITSGDQSAASPTAQYFSFASSLGEYIRNNYAALRQDPALREEVTKRYGKDFMPRLGYLIQVWNDPTKRFAVLQQLSQLEGGLNGLDGLDGFFSNIKDAISNVADKVKDNKVGSAVQNVASTLNRGNLVLVGVRGGFLKALERDINGMATKLAVGYMSENTARTRGYNLSVWQRAVKARKQVEAKWDTLGGKVDKLRASTVEGNGKSTKFANLQGFELAAGVTVGGLIALVTAILNAVNWEGLKAAKENDGQLDVGEVFQNVNTSEVANAWNQFQSEVEASQGKDNQNNTLKPGTDSSGSTGSGSIWELINAGSSAVGGGSAPGTQGSDASGASSGNITTLDPSSQNNTAGFSLPFLNNLPEPVKKYGPWVVGGGALLYLGYQAMNSKEHAATEDGKLPSKKSETEKQAA